MSCLLNDPSEFVGGELEFKMPDKVAFREVVMVGQKTEIKLKKQEVLLFPPSVEHQVLPVFEGTRDSLVVWFLEKEWPLHWRCCGFRSTRRLLVCGGVCYGRAHTNTLDSNGAPCRGLLLVKTTRGAGAWFKWWTCSRFVICCSCTCSCNCRFRR